MRAHWMLCAAAMALAAPVSLSGQTPAPPSGAPNLEGWTMTPEGLFHEASATRCPAMADGFDAVVLSPPSAPRELGTCRYPDTLGTGDAGIRVRTYVSGEGESEQAIAQDRALMEPKPGEAAPMMTVRIVAVPLADGRQGGRVTITKTRGGLLIDCYADDADLAGATSKIAEICGN